MKHESSNMSDDADKANEPTNDRPENSWLESPDPHAVNPGDTSIPDAHRPESDDTVGDSDPVHVGEASESPTFGPSDTVEPDLSPATSAVATTVGGSAEQHGISELRNWAATHRCDDDPYIRGLLTAVEQRQDLTMWAALDPVELLPHPPVRRGRFMTRIARVMLFLRNVLVFIPVAITWMGIKEATEAFGAYAAAENAANSGKQLNFLLFWESGGPKGQLASMWRIQHIALVDALLIAGIVVLTLLSGAIEARANRKADMQERRFEAERVGIALAVKAALHGNRQATPESITQSLAESLADLMSGARLMNNAALRMETLSVGLETVGPRFADLNRRLDHLSGALSGQMLGSVEQLRASVTQLGSTVDGELAQVLTKVLVGLDEIREQLGKTSASVEFGTKNLRDDLDAIHGRLAGVVRGGRP